MFRFGQFCVYCLCHGSYTVRDTQFILERLII